MTLRLFAAAATVLMAFAAWSAARAPDAASVVRQGEAGAAVCEACHGAQGQGSLAVGAPRLAGLDAGYLERRLEEFASGTQPAPTMTPIAQALTPEERRALSRWFSALPARREAGPFDASRLARGRTLAKDGDWPVGAPPCAACHGPEGQGVGSLAPPLVGQSQAYLLQALMAFHEGRRSGPLGLMSGVAGRLSTQDLRAAAAYYASLPIPSERPNGDRP